MWVWLSLDQTQNLEEGQKFRFRSSSLACSVLLFKVRSSSNFCLLAVNGFAVMIMFGQVRKPVIFACANKLFVHA